MFKNSVSCTFNNIDLAKHDITKHLIIWTDLYSFFRNNNEKMRYSLKYGRPKGKRNVRFLLKNLNRIFLLFKTNSFSLKINISPNIFSSLICRLFVIKSFWIKCNTIVWKIYMINNIFLVLCFKIIQTILRLHKSVHRIAGYPRLNGYFHSFGFYHF